MNSLEGKLNGRRPQWKTTLMEEALYGRGPQWRTTLMEDDLNERKPQFCTELGPAQPQLVYDFFND